VCALVTIRKPLYGGPERIYPSRGDVEPPTVRDVIVTVSEQSFQNPRAQLLNVHPFLGRISDTFPAEVRQTLTYSRNDDRDRGSGFADRSGVATGGNTRGIVCD